MLIRQGTLRCFVTKPLGVSPPQKKTHMIPVRDTFTLYPLPFPPLRLFNASMPHTRGSSKPSP